MTVETGPGWELRCCDCLDPEHGLPSLEACDHVITDPPYDERTHSSGGKVRRADSGPSLDTIDFAPLLSVSPLAEQFRRVAARWTLVNCAVSQINEWDAAMGGLVRACAWVKPDSMPQVTGDRPGQGWEPLLVFHAPGRKRWNGGGARGVYTATVNGWHREHPTQKPLALVEALVRDFTDLDDLVCDPFAGSGTTGVACIRLGRRFIGWERDPKYFAIAVKRLRMAREQTRLFDGA